MWYQTGCRDKNATIGYLSSCKQAKRHWRDQDDQVKKWESMHCISRNFVKSSCEYHPLILTATWGRGLKKDFGDLRRKQEAWLDEYPYQLFRGSSTLTSYKDCSQDLASGLKLNFRFSGRMEHVVIGEKLHEDCVLFMGKESGWEPDGMARGF